MDHSGVAREWFQYANTDLESAKFLKEMKPMPMEVICYHCQQSAEKYLKGFLALNGGEIQKSHDLVSLNKLCSAHNIQFQNIMEECIGLTDYGVQARYPFQIEIEAEDVLLALKSADSIRQFVLKLINL